MARPPNRENTRSEAPPQVDNPPDDAAVNPTDHRTAVDHIFFQASNTYSHEQSQAVTRVVVTLLVTTALLTNAFIDRIDDDIKRDIVIAASYLGYSLLHYVWVNRARERFLWRRYLAITGDLLCTSYITHRFGLVGLGFFSLYLWIIVGNGLRFGPHYLRVATLVGITGFLVATWLNRVIFEHSGLVIGLLVGLLLMPRFFLVMIRRLAEVNLALKSQKEQAEHLAQHDVLTGLPNRALLEMRINHSLAVAERGKGQLAVLFIDLDDFKAINDTFGHDCGDLLLRQLSGCLKTSVRRSDTVARIGGDEFIILAEKLQRVGEIAAIVEQLFRCAGRHYTLDHHRVHVTWSCGIAIYPHDGTDCETLIRNADTAMYRAKATGTNQFRLFNPSMSERVTSQLQRRDELRRAVETAQFEVRFQPQMRVSDRRLVGVEALLWWRHPARGLLPPSEFLPLARRSGLVQTLGRLTLEQALAEAAAWHGNGYQGLRLFVAVTARHLAAPSFVPELRELLNMHHYPASALGIVLNEDTLFDEVPSPDEQFATLRQNGIGLTLDRFGTAHASLDHLNRLPIDRVKIDPSIIAGIPRNVGDCKLVDAIVNLARHFEIEALADGVATETQLKWLREHRCDVLQGDLVSPPLSATALDGFLSRMSPADPTVPG